MMPLGVSLEFSVSSRGSKTAVVMPAAWGRNRVIRAVKECPMSSAFHGLPSHTDCCSQRLYYDDDSISSEPDEHKGDYYKKAVWVYRTYPLEDHFKGFEFQPC